MGGDDGPGGRFGFGQQRIEGGGGDKAGGVLLVEPVGVEAVGQDPALPRMG